MAKRPKPPPATKKTKTKTKRTAPTLKKPTKKTNSKQNEPIIVASTTASSHELNHQLVGIVAFLRHHELHMGADLVDVERQGLCDDCPVMTEPTGHWEWKTTSTACTTKTTRWGAKSATKRSATTKPESSESSNDDDDDEDDAIPSRPVANSKAVSPDDDSAVSDVDVSDVSSVDVSSSDDDSESEDESEDESDESDDDSDESVDDVQLRHDKAAALAAKTKEAAQAAREWQPKPHTPGPNRIVTTPGSDGAQALLSHGQPFARVDSDYWGQVATSEGGAMADNSYTAVFGDSGYGAKSSEKLLAVRGKDFAREKNKRKRTFNGFSRNGGHIDAASTFSTKYVYE